jgi:hypothetical protein
MSTPADSRERLPRRDASRAKVRKRAVEAGTATASRRLVAVSRKAVTRTAPIVASRPCATAAIRRQPRYPRNARAGSFASLPFDSFAKSLRAFSFEFERCCAQRIEMVVHNATPVNDNTTNGRRNGRACA